MLNQQESRILSDRNSDIGLDQNITATQTNINYNLHQNQHDSSADKYKNDEWRRRDFDDDYIKNTLNEFKTTVRYLIFTNSWFY